MWNFIARLRGFSFYILLLFFYQFLTIQVSSIAYSILWWEASMRKRNTAKLKVELLHVRINFDLSWRKEQWRYSLTLAINDYFGQTGSLTRLVVTTLTFRESCRPKISRSLFPSPSCYFSSTFTLIVSYDTVYYLQPDRHNKSAAPQGQVGPRDEGSRKMKGRNEHVSRSNAGLQEG